MKTPKFLTQMEEFENMTNKSKERSEALNDFMKAKEKVVKLENENSDLKLENEELADKLKEKEKEYQNLFAFIQNLNM